MGPGNILLEGKVLLNMRAWKRGGGARGELIKSGEERGREGGGNEEYRCRPPTK